MSYKTEFNIRINTALQNDAEIPLRRLLINMGLLKDAERVKHGSYITYTMNVTAEQIEILQKQYP